MTDVYIIGSKGLPAAYGGYETFVERLVDGQRSGEIRYHVACAQEMQPVRRRTVRQRTVRQRTAGQQRAGQQRASQQLSSQRTAGQQPARRQAAAGSVYVYSGAECFFIPYRTQRACKAMFYDLDAFRWALADAAKRRTDGESQRFVVYVLACRIGPFFRTYVRKAHELGGSVWINPDGHEWLRSKWSIPVRLYWKLSECLMVKHADLVICDSKKIRSYIRAEYPAAKGKCRYLSYGADLPGTETKAQKARYGDWCRQHRVQPDGYDLIVGRFVPENNYEVMLREFMASHTKRRLVIVTDHQGSAYYSRLQKKTGFSGDPRILFVGTVYDKELLTSIRRHAHAYLHGHSVGGTNPSLLEALAATKTNLLYNVGFHREVAGRAAYYWSRQPGDLAALIDRVDRMDSQQGKRMGAAAKERIRKSFTWEKIVGEYEKLFLRER